VLRTAGGENLVALVRKDCRQLFCIFAGRAGQMMRRRAWFLERARLADRNLVIFRDPFNADYRRGLGGDIPDFPSLVDWQHRRYGHLPHVTETYCVGASMGGLAAMRFGYHLRARTVWAFAPRPYTWYRARRTVGELADLLSTGNGTTEYRIYYSVHSWVDRKVAAALSACPGVVCCPQQAAPFGLGHLVQAALERSATFHTLFPPFAPARSPEAATPGGPTMRA
jgi:hypothetical protein